MLDKKSQQFFCSFLEELYESQQAFDYIKKQLTSHKYYDPNLIFDLIAQGDQFITRQNLLRYLQNKIAINQRQLYDIFEKFDWERQGRISPQNFCSEMVPFASRFTSPQTSSLTSQIQGVFLSLIIQITKRLRILDVARKQVKYIMPYESFQHICHNKTGCIGIIEIRKLFQANDFNPSQQQLYYLLHGLRRRCYNDINLEVFCENLDPLQFGYYLAYNNEVEKQRQNNMLSRSRADDEVMRRSRQQAQMAEHEVLKAERKSRAEIQRQLELEERINREIVECEEVKQQYMRKALLEDERQMRHNAVLNNQLFHQQRVQNVRQQYENQYLASIRQRQAEVNAALSNSVLQRQSRLENSRRLLENQRIEKQRILYEDQRKRQIIAKELQMSRWRQEQENLRQREKYIKNLEYERAKAGQESRMYQDMEYQRVKIEQGSRIHKSNRIAEYQKELQRTRFEIAERRSRITAPYSSYKK